MTGRHCGRFAGAVLGLAGRGVVLALDRAPLYLGDRQGRSVNPPVADSCAAPLLSLHKPVMCHCLIRSHALLWVPSGRDSEGTKNVRIISIRIKKNNSPTNATATCYVSDLIASVFQASYCTDTYSRQRLTKSRKRGSDDLRRLARSLAPGILIMPLVFVYGLGLPLKSECEKRLTLDTVDINSHQANVSSEKYTRMPCAVRSVGTHQKTSSS